jgi:hypothetical protein
MLFNDASILRFQEAHQRQRSDLLLNRGLLYFQKHVKDAVIFIMVLRRHLHLLPIMSIFDQTIPYFASWPDYLIFMQKNLKKLLKPLFAIAVEQGEQN